MARQVQAGQQNTSIPRSDKKFTRKWFLISAAILLLLIVILLPLYINNLIKLLTLLGVGSLAPIVEIIRPLRKESDGQESSQASNPGNTAPPVIVQIVNGGQGGSNAATSRPSESAGLPTQQPETTAPPDPLRPQETRTPPLAAVPPPGGHRPSINTTPDHKNPHYTDRESYLTILRDNFADTTQLRNTQALIGPPGMGTTEIAIEYARRFATAYDYIFWITSNPDTARKASVAQIAQQLGIQANDIADIVTWLATLEAEKQWLLVLDQLYDPAQTAQLNAGDFIPQAGQGHILLTTSNREPVRPEAVRRIDVRGMEDEDGALFLLRSISTDRQVRTPQDAQPADFEAARAISRELGGLPIALHGAGLYIQDVQCSLTDYLAMCHDQQRHLETVRACSKEDARRVAHWLVSYKAVSGMSRAAGALLRFCAFLACVPLSRQAMHTAIASIRLPALSPLTADLQLLQEITQHPHLWNNAVGNLRRFCLVETTGDTITTYLTIQQALREDMGAADKSQWAELVAAAIFELFREDVRSAGWQRRSLPHADACAHHIDQLQITSAQAVELLLQAGAALADLDVLEDRLFEQATYYFTLAKRICATGGPTLARCLSGLALLYAKQADYKLTQGNNEQAEDLYTKALDLCKTPDYAGQLQAANCLNSLANLYRNQGRYALAEDCYQQAVEACRVLPLDHADRIASIYHLRSLYDDWTALYYMDRSATHWDKSQAALALCEDYAQHPDPAALSPKTPGACNHLGWIYFRLGESAQACRLHKRARELAEGQYVFRAEKATACVHLAALDLHLAGQAASKKEKRECYSRAMASYAEGLTIRSALFPEHHLAIAAVHRGLALLYFTHPDSTPGKLEQALRDYERALAIYRTCLGAQHPSIAVILHDEALVLEKKSHSTGLTARQQAELRARAERIKLQAREIVSTWKQL
ncbi:MAG TPA: tetratricopeptide repeat protein [Ktedonobacteraceae bacterium]|jgi:tetratricopeptide (TPR) repeat protein